MFKSEEYSSFLNILIISYLSYLYSSFLNINYKFYIPVLSFRVSYKATTILSWVIVPVFTKLADKNLLIWKHGKVTVPVVSLQLNLQFTFFQIFGGFIIY